MFKITSEDAKIANKTISDICSFVAMRGLWTEEIPEVARVMKIIKEIGESGKVFVVKEEMEIYPNEVCGAGLLPNEYFKKD